MTDLITKEELLELGFKQYIDIFDEIYYELLINNDDVIKIDLKNNNAILNQTFGCCDNEFATAYCDATKANIFKLIEIVKLIGELK